ncbi:MAG: short chain dehydrogenase/reductase family oxidoreductase [Ilumatobacteraceae bacterium]|nr:short chain dehydrogenase/reductase family oxidoreductase [Ilumatobacteraceae bacterium]
MTAARTALVLGGNSDIALATLHRLADSGLERVVLAARDVEALERRLETNPLPVAEVTIVAWDALDPTGHVPLVETAAEALGGIDLVLCAVGSLGHGAGIAATSASAASLFESNFSGPATALTDIAQYLVERGFGSIVVLSSVAALRPRRSNYLYGSAKAGLDAFALGLADAVAGSGVLVHVIRPGFVTSKMTTGLRPAPFATTPEAVADAIADTLTSEKSRIVHVPRVLGPLFALLRITPRPIWRRIAGDR